MSAFLAEIGGCWVITIWRVEYVIRRAKKIKENWHRPAILSGTVHAPAPEPTRTTSSQQPGSITSLPVPTSGEASEDEHNMISGRQADQVVYDNNYLTPMQSKKCKATVGSGADLMFGDSIVIPPGNVISSKQGRFEVNVCKDHLDEYMGRRKDVGCETKGCFARGILVKVGDIAIRECNGHIGLMAHRDEGARLPSVHLSETGGGETGMSESSGMVGKKDSKLPETSGAIVLADEEGYAQPVLGQMQLIDGRLVVVKKRNQADVTENHAETGVESNCKESGDRKGEVRPTTSTICEPGGMPTLTPGVKSKVAAKGPVGADQETSSGREKNHLGRIWGGRISDRRLSLETMSSGRSRKGRRNDDKKTRGEAYQFDDDRSATSKQKRKVRHQSSSTRSSSSPVDSSGNLGRNSDRQGGMAKGGGNAEQIMTCQTSCVDRLRRNPPTSGYTS